MGDSGSADLLSSLSRPACFAIFLRFIHKHKCLSVCQAKYNITFPSIDLILTYLYPQSLAHFPRAGHFSTQS